MEKFAESTDKKFAEEILKEAPIQAKTWLNFDHQVMESETAIPLKYKELMALAVALTTQCPYCLEKHTGRAKKLGATKAEISETIMIAAALRSGAALGYGLLTMKFYMEEED